MRVGWTGLAIISLSAGCGRIAFDAVDPEDAVIGEPRTCRDVNTLQVARFRLVPLGVKQELEMEPSAVVGSDRWR